MNISRSDRRLKGTKSYVELNHITIADKATCLQDICESLEDKFPILSCFKCKLCIVLLMYGITIV